MQDSLIYHELAKQSGDKLRSYILTLTSSASGLYFYTLIFAPPFDYWQRLLLLHALTCSVLATVASLWELRIDAKRFYWVAKAIEKDSSDTDWSHNKRFKQTRLILIYASYFFILLGVLDSLLFLIIHLY